MPDKEVPEDGSWLSTIIEGGLPQVLAGPAGKAISRLIGTSVDIPAAYLEGIAQGIRDKADARSQISRAIAKQTAESASNDPEIMQRAMNSMIARSYRSQKNKDSVVETALKDLKDDPARPDSPGPSDDWLTKFERYAEDASSEELRTMFGKLLAGEIRQPGAISPATLNFVSMLDSETAKLIERALPSCTYNGAAFVDCINPKLGIPEVAFIEQSGFWTTGKFRDFTLDNTGNSFIPTVADNVGVALMGKQGLNFNLSAAILSRAGYDLAKIVKVGFDHQKFADILFDNGGIEKIHYTEGVIKDDRISISSQIELFRSDKASE